MLVLATSACGSGDDVAEGSAEEVALAERWFAWAAAEPEETSPVADTDGSDCTRNQPEDVWFLANTFGVEVSRRCLVPAGRTVFAPVLTELCQPGEPCEIDDPELEATLDGEPLEVFRLDLEAFELTGNPDSLLTLDGATVEVVATGYWVRIDSLEPGTHQLTLAGRDTSTDFATRVQYELAVG